MRGVIGRWSTVALAAAAMGFAGVGTASAATPAPYPPSAPVCSITPSQTPANSAVTVSGNGFAPAKTLNVTGTGVAVVTNATTPSGSNGVYSVQERVGSAGSAIFTISEPSSGQSVTCDPPVTVLAPATTPKSNVKARSQVGAVSTDRPTVGNAFTFSGCGYKPGSTVTVEDTGGTSYGTAKAGSDGCYSQRLIMASTGCRTLVGTGSTADGGPLTTTRRICVMGLTFSRTSAISTNGGGGSGTGSGLAFTGADGLGMLILLGSALVGAGSVLATRGRRR